MGRERRGKMKFAIIASAIMVIGGVAFGLLLSYMVYGERLWSILGC